MTYAFEPTKVPPEDPEDEFDLIHVNKCGISNQQFSIIGGTDAGENEYPHMVAIGNNQSLEDFTYWFCGGSLISERFVITAAHCATNQTVRSIGQIGTPNVIMIGGWNISEGTEKNAKIIEIEEIILYPEYRKAQVYHDIALIKLKDTISLGPNIKPICLPQDESTTETTYWATGWGNKIDSDLIGVLQKVDLGIVGDEECSTVYTPKLSKRLSAGLQPHQLCLGRVENKDACRGASGGPVQIINKNIFCSYTLVAVTSSGLQCGKGNPGLFVKVFHYLDWIENIVWK